MLDRRFALFTAVFTGLLAIHAAPAEASARQQELYVLSRFNSIWRIDGFDTTNPTPVLVTQWGVAPGSTYTACCPLGLDRDPSTGDFFVLAGDWNGNSGNGAQLLRVDAVSGLTTVAYDLPYHNLNGLERRWDNKLVTFENLETLVTIDLRDGSTIETPLASPITGLGSIFAAFDLDERGYVQVLAEASVEIDPALGISTPSAGPSDQGHYGGAFAISNAGDYYLGSVFPGNLYRFDRATQTWQLIHDQGYSTMNNIYDFALTRSNDGSGFTPVCDGAINSTGARSSMELLGVSAVSANDLRLVARDLPPNSFGMYLMGASAGSAPVGSGTLCILPTVFRYGASRSAVQGTYAFDVDLTNLPGGQPAMANTTRIFQFWYRDSVAGVATSNLSDAVAVSFR